MSKTPTPKPKNRPPRSRPAAPVAIQSGSAAGVPAPILEEEIAALRASARKMLVHAEGVEDPLDAVKAFSAFGAQIVRIANLLRLQTLLTGGAQGDTIAAINSALAQIAQEWVHP